MKIYNKKAFALGVFMMALGLLNLITSMEDRQMPICGGDIVCWIVKG